MRTLHISTKTKTQKIIINSLSISITLQIKFFKFALNTTKMFTNSNEKTGKKMKESINTIGVGTTINGEIMSKGDIRVDGTLKGSINTSGKVVLGKEGVVEGGVVCNSADIAGTIKAKITVSELLILKETAKLTGDIVANKLSIEPGASFTGSCSMGAVIKDIKDLGAKQGEKEKTAYHEAGHAILNVLLEHTDPLHKVTIIPRGPALGVTMFLPEEDKYTQRKFEMLDHLVVAMGGRVAEEIVFGDVTNGAGGDIKMATDVARKMVCQWGMSEDLGMVEYGDHQEHKFLARDMTATRSYSESTAQKIDSEVKRLIDTAYNKAREMLLSHREELDLIAHALLEYETLDASHIKDLMDDGEMSDPPPSPMPPEIDTENKKLKNSEDSSHGDDISPGELSPVGA